MRKYKAKAIQADLGIFTHVPAYSDISRHIQPDIIRHIQAYSKPCVTLTYSERLQFVQNPGIFTTRGIFMILIYLEPRHIQNHSLFRSPEHFGEIVNILYEINTMNVFNTGVIFTSIAFILCRKSMGSQLAGAHEYPKKGRNIKQILICSETKTS